MSCRFIKGSSGLWNQNSAVKFIDEGDERDSGVHVCLRTELALPLKTVGPGVPADGGCVK